MKALVTLLLLLALAVGLLLLTCGAEGQEVAAPAEGRWKGAIETPGGTLGVEVFLVRDGDAWSGTIDIPAQGAKGLALEKITVEGGQAIFSIAGVPGAPRFEGAVSETELKGTFYQGGGSVPFRLEKVEKGAPAEEAQRRPQDPVPPFPYSEEEVTVQGGAGKLAGTLTLPPGDGPHPAALLLTGSGAQNRDSEIFDHRYFQVLADHLTRQGIAVLRLDDRGVGGSEGNLGQASLQDQAADVLAAVAFLEERPEIGPVGLIGQSEGGVVGPMAAVQSEDVRFVVLLMSPAVSMRTTLERQKETMLRAAGHDEETIAASRRIHGEILDLVEAEGEATPEKKAKAVDLALEEMDLLGAGLEPQVARAQIEAQLDGVWQPAFRSALAHDPAKTLARLQQPVLALWGGKDMQVEAAVNRPVMEEALEKGGNEDVTLDVVPGLNHLMQTATTGLPSEYATIEESVAPALMERVAAWILERFPAAGTEESRRDAA